jgi:hypothetical protein
MEANSEKIYIHQLINGVEVNEEAYHVEILVVGKFDEYLYYVTDNYTSQYVNTLGWNLDVGRCYALLYPFWFNDEITFAVANPIQYIGTRPWDKRG